MRKRISIIGKVFGKLTVTADAPDGKNTYGHPMRRVFCRCECGKVINVTKGALTKGNTKTCGCSHKKGNPKHGGRYSGAYNSWCAMKSRCFNPRNDDFHHYGGRGITVCDSWKNSFENFYRYMGDKPVGKSLGRIDNSKNYEPGNCEWQTQPVQMRSTRRNNFVTVDGVTLCFTDMCKLHNFHRSTVRRRLKRGLTIQQAFSKSGRLV